MRNNDLRKIVDLFKFYQISITKNESFRFKMTDNRKKMIESFCEQIKADTNSIILQDDYINMFFEFQFNNWYKQEASLKKGNEIQIEWIIGKKAVKRWKDRTDKQKKHFSFIQTKGIKKDLKLKNKKKYNEGWSESLLSTNKAEEKEKEMYFESAKGFINCSINTTLFNHKSIFCMKCPSKEKCKKQLLNQYPNVYKLRGY